MAGAGGTWEISVPSPQFWSVLSPQFCCKSKTALKRKFVKDNKAAAGSHLPVMPALLHELGDAHAARRLPLERDRRPLAGPWGRDAATVLPGGRGHCGDVTPLAGHGQVLLGKAL